MATGKKKKDKREKVKIKWCRRRRSSRLTERGFVKFETKRGAEIERQGKDTRECEKAEKEENEMRKTNGKRKVH